MNLNLRHERKCKKGHVGCLMYDICVNGGISATEGEFYYIARQELSITKDCPHTRVFVAEQVPVLAALLKEQQRERFGRICYELCKFHERSFKFG